MTSAVRYRYTDLAPTAPGLKLMPYLPITLSNGDFQLETSGLLDSGAAANVLPHSAGVQLGLVWDELERPITLTGNLAAYEASIVIGPALVAQFQPVRLTFAWTQSDNVPLILGQANFFAEFDVCFYRSRVEFSVT